MNFERIIRALNDVNYQGPLSVEWEDIGMDREHGATEAAAFVRRLDFPPSKVAFDAAFEKKSSRNNAARRAAEGAAASNAGLRRSGRPGTRLGDFALIFFGVLFFAELVGEVRQPPINEQAGPDNREIP